MNEREKERLEALYRPTHCVPKSSCEKIFIYACNVVMSLRIDLGLSISMHIKICVLILYVGSPA